MNKIFKKIVFAGGILLLSTQVMAGNPNGGGGGGGGATPAQAAQIQANADAIAALENPTEPAIATPRDGGVVACTLSSGGFNLITSSADEADSAWSNIEVAVIGISAQSDTSGANNTPAIIAQSGFTGGAAQVCRDKTTGGYTDWYLPAINELNCLYTNRATIGDFASAIYWSSTEIVSSVAAIINFSNGAIDEDDKTSARNVRCVRAFTP